MATPQSVGIVLPTHDLALDDPSQFQLGGFADATVTAHDGCVYIEYTHGKWLVVWPAGTILDSSESPSVIRAAGGHAITAIGSQFSLSGAVYEADQRSEVSAVSLDLSEACVGDPYVLAEQRTGALPIGPASWRIDPAQPAPDSTAQTIHLLINEQACASGQSPEGRIQDPIIDYSADAITITIAVLNVGGRCPGNPDFPLEVTLDEPIGPRDLIDGSTGTNEWESSGD